MNGDDATCSSACWRKLKIDRFDRIAVSSPMSLLIMAWLYGAVGPFDVEVCLDERSTLVVDGIDQRFGIRFAIALTNQTTYLFRSRSVEKESQSVLARSKKMLCPSPYNHATFRRCRSLDDLCCETLTIPAASGASLETRGLPS
jgi:hypothetical protein